MDLDKQTRLSNEWFTSDFIFKLKKRSRNSSDGEVENITYEMHSETKSLVNSLLNSVLYFLKHLNKYCTYHKNPKSIN